jgi:hypothetical protein
MEHWKPAFGFEGIYEVSDRGQIRRIKKAMGTRAGKVLKSWGGNGYQVTALRINGAYKTIYVHRLTLQSFTDPSEHRPQVNHKNGKRADNRLQNLEWCTAAENLMHATRTLGKRRGSNHWRAKLDEGAVSRMRMEYAAGQGVSALARKFGITHATASRVLSGKIWRHVPGVLFAHYVRSREGMK